MKKSLQKYWKKTRAISPLQNTNSTADQSIVGSDDNFETFAIVSTTVRLLTFLKQKYCIYKISF